MPIIFRRQAVLSELSPVNNKKLLGDRYPRFEAQRKGSVENCLGDIADDD